MEKVKAEFSFPVVNGMVAVEHVRYMKLDLEASQEACRAFLAWASSGIDGMPDADQLEAAVEKARSALGLV